MDPNYSGFYGSGSGNLANFGENMPGGNGVDMGSSGGGGMGGMSPGGNTPWGSLVSMGGHLLSDLFSHPGQPYQNAMNQVGQYTQQGANALNPYAQGGANEIPQYQQWLKSMQNPSQFENNLMSQYQESPTAKYMQQQAVRSAQNAGSSSGLMGSTPMEQQVQQNASNISQQDMGNWLQNALGINTQYGQGMNNMINTGEQGANSLANLYQNEGNTMGNLAYGQGVAQNQNQANIFSDIFG